jgi:hypothetical protein
MEAQTWMSPIISSQITIYWYKPINRIGCHGSKVLHESTLFFFPFFLNVNLDAKQTFSSHSQMPTFSLNHHINAFLLTHYLCTNINFTRSLWFHKYSHLFQILYVHTLKAFLIQTCQFSQVSWIANMNYIGYSRHLS